MIAQEEGHAAFMGIGPSIIKSNLKNISDIENSPKQLLKLLLVSIKICSLVVSSSLLNTLIIS